MKTLNNIVKILTALATVAGVVYIVATYGDKIVAWAKKLLASCPCKCEAEDCADCQCEQECPCETAAEAPAEEAVEEVVEEVVAEEAPAEEIVVEENEPVADEADFAE